MLRSFPAFRESIALLAATIPAGCSLTPPAVLEAEAAPLEQVLERCPTGAEAVELSPAPDVRLRGVFVPAGPNAPVVLHLLESSATVGARRASPVDLFARLADLGLASLMVDYTGVGASSGERSPRNLERDARAMWEEALRRAGGDPSRVIVRGISLGTISTALLLRGGARPGAVVLILTVRAETVAARFARSFYGLLPALAASWFYGPVSDVDLVREISAFPGPLLVVGTTEEIMLTDEEQAMIESAVARSGGTWKTRPGGHLIVTAESRGGLPEELEYYASRFPPPRASAEEVARFVESLPPEYAERLAPGTAERERAAEFLTYGRASDPRWVAATAMLGGDPAQAMRLRWMLSVCAPRDATLEERLALADLSDPDGPLPLEVLEACHAPFEVTRRCVSLAFLMSPKQVAQCARSRGDGASIEYTVQFPGGNVARVATDFPAAWRALAASGLPEEDVRRRFARVILKAYGKPDRLVDGGNGSRPGLQVCEWGAWSDLSLDEEEGGDATTFTIEIGAMEAKGKLGE